MSGLALLRYWREGLIGLVLLFAAIQWGNARHWNKMFVNEQKGHAQTRADYTAFARGVREKSEQIVSKATERNKRIAAEYRAIEKENDSEIRRRIDAAVARVRAQGGASAGSSGNPATSASQAPGGAAGAGETAIVPARDLEICAEAVIKAEGWQEWFRRVSSVARE